jgi:hypothetical protein
MRYIVLLAPDRTFWYICTILIMILILTLPERMIMILILTLKSTLLVAALNLAYCAALNLPYCERS